MEDTKALLVEVFGESSEEDEALLENGSPPNHCWQRIEEIEGLWLCRDFLSPQQQSSLLSAIHEGALFSVLLLLLLLFAKRIFIFSLNS